MHHTITVDPETYELVVEVLGDFEYRGNFAQAVGDYLAEASVAGENIDKKTSLKGCVYQGPLAEYEQVIVALWDTVPKFVFNEEYKKMLAAISHVIYFFKTGDVEGFSKTIQECGGFSPYTRPADVLDHYLEDLETYFEITVVEKEYEEVEIEDYEEVEIA